MAFEESTGIIPVERRDEADVSNISSPFPSVNPVAPYTVIDNKFTQTLELANDMIDKLQGIDGNSGYLGDMNDLIVSYTLPVLPDLTVSIDTSSVGTVTPAPSADLTGVVTSFSAFGVGTPTPISLPTIDTSSLALVSAPDSSGLTSTINWSEIALNSDIYDELLARIKNDIIAGSTGLDASVEAEIWARAIARQGQENDKRIDEIDGLYSGSRWDVPSGAYIAAQAEVGVSNGINTAEINGKITIQSSDLAQKNSQFIITQAVELEKMFRDTRDSESNRVLDKEKNQMVYAIQMYAEKVKAYIGEMEANKIYIEAQLDALTGAVEYNKGLFDNFATQAKVYETVVSAQSKVNETIVGIYEAEIKGYEAEQKAISANQMVITENNKALVAKAEVQLRAIIAKIEATLKGYESEMSLKEKVSSDMASFASQCVASALSSTNVSASMGYSAGESRSESFQHSESISQQDSFSSSIQESHSYEHDPSV